MVRKWVSVFCVINSVFLMYVTLVVGQLICVSDVSNAMRYG